MKQSLIVDYLSCSLFKVLSFFTSFLPLNFNLFWGRRLGDLIYFFDKKHRRIASANIRYAFRGRLGAGSCLKVTRQAYRAFGQNLIEISVLGRINNQYLEKYIHIENREFADLAFKRGKGVIFVGVHGGNWELSNIICANLGVPFTLFVRDQGLPRLNELLNSYRLKLGAKIFHKNAGVRQLIEVLRNNQAIGMTIDQGGKAGQIVKFFGKEASMAMGAVKLALKYDCAIVPVFYARLRGPHTKVILDQVYTVSRSADPENDVRENLQKLINIYEKYIRKYPREYLWSYKIWKYGREKDILILSDSKTGHLRQSEAVARLIDEKYKSNGFKTNIFIKEVKFRSEITKLIFNLVKAFGFLGYALPKGSRDEFLSLKPDVVISTGSSVSAVNYLLSRESGAKSICLMKPGAGSLAKFDLTIIPQHDRPEGRGFGPARKKNVVVTEGALNLIEAGYLKEKSQRLEQSGLLRGELLKPCIGLLIGGTAKGFSIKPDIIEALCREIKKSARDLNASILISTSRRTPFEIEARIKKEFTGYPSCNLLVIANENNNPDVAGGIFGLSDIIISSPDSISMISEAVSAKKYVVVFKNDFVSEKHKLFLKVYQEKKYIYLKQIDELSKSLNDIWHNRPQVNFTDDNSKVAEALNKIL